MLNIRSIVVLLAFVGAACYLFCNKKKNNQGLKDGRYSAKLEYHSGGTFSSVTTHVDIKNNKLAKIDWPKEEWPKVANFTPPDITDNPGSFNSNTSTGYTISILGEEDCPENE